MTRVVNTGKVKLIMDISTILEGLKDKDDNKAYALTRQISAESAESDKYYQYFEEFAKLLDDKKSYIRTRSIMLCCAQARWDERGKISNTLPKMLALLHDEKPTVVRKSLEAMHEVALFRPELCQRIMEEIETIDLTRYKDSMAPLIEKDLNELIKVLE